MTYESLLLNSGGGIIDKNDRSPQFQHSAALCIGIGGTGVAALSDLKGKIYQQLEPDNPNPDDPTPKYEGIQLLGIDSDEGAYQKYTGNRRLTEAEFFTIHKPNLSNIFTKETDIAMIKNDPLLHWMEIDKITKLLTSEGAGGIRQLGRFLLISKASSLYNEIQSKCSDALKKRGCNSLDIYIFAGISGGTGSGCFLDVCYLVRKVMDDNGWNAKIMGYFFLPDVVTSKSEVSNQKSSVDYNNSNGYAALKELDYLMHLKDSNDWFDQNYGAGIKIHTQLPPVDMCHLISASKADGTLVKNGFNYGINVASDYAMAYLAEVDLSGEKDAEESSLTMRGHLANVSRGVLGIPRRWGANLSYHILGASNAEIPMTQINTYLAIGFFEKFRQFAYRPKTTINKDEVDMYMAELRLTAENVYEDIVSDSPELSITHYSDRKELAKYCPKPRGTFPEIWGKEGNSWMSVCNGVMTRNVESLNKELDGYSYDKINDQSLIGRLFRKIWDLSLDPKFGPYYAAALLSNSGEDLLAALDGEIQTAHGKAEDQRIQIPLILDNLEHWSSELNRRKGKKQDYENYYSECERYYMTSNAEVQCIMTEKALRDFRKQVEALYNNFFRPLCELLDNLMETFRENDSYLKLPESKEPNAYTWQILTLDDIKDRLDDAVKALNAKQVVSDFVRALMRKPDMWSPDKIGVMIRHWMLDLFTDEAKRNLQDYLFDKYPETKPDVDKLAEKIKTDILNRVNSKAVPMFWCDPSYDISDPKLIFESSSLSVPNTCVAVCSAAESFKGNNKNYAVRKTGIGDRIFALRFISGIPLFAYQGVEKLKAAYDAAGNKPSGAGSHLFAKTGRAREGVVDVDWRSYLPIPMPYSKVKGTAQESMHPSGKTLSELYAEAVKRGVIGIIQKEENDDLKLTASETEVNDTETEKKKENDSYAIFVTPDIQVKDYCLQDFMDGDTFIKSAYDAELKKIQEQIRLLHAFGENEKCSAIELKNDGDEDLCTLENVRIDYFVQYKPLQRLVRKEIQKDKALKDAEETLISIGEEYFSYEKDLTDFANLLFHGVLVCKDKMGKLNYAQTATVRSSYQDKYKRDQECYLCGAKAKYPLYEAFEFYRVMKDNNALAYAVLKKALEKLENINEYELSQTYVAAILEQVWDADAMKALKEETIKGESEVMQMNIIRFYEGLCAKIRDFRDGITQWPVESNIEELTEMILGNGQKTRVEKAQVPVMLPQQIYVWYNNETMTVYTDRSVSYAWSVSRNDWVKLNTDMYVAKGTEWVKIQLDSNGNLIYN